MVQLPGGAAYVEITQNEFVGRRHRKLKEEDIAICECKYDSNNPESACGDSCLNALTNTECTPGYCPCSDQCKNQKFQKHEYAKTKLFKTEGRGWGLLADEDIKAGQFVIEYCGEVISAEDAQERSHNYEAEGLKDAYIISLNGNCFIDATKKGSPARFINHSCDPNCETRKWTVLGETRVGIFAKKDISAGFELAYDYNFEWYGGETVRCLCGAAKCSLFLGARSHGFQEYNHVWEDGDDRYTIENIPIYDSAEDEPFADAACIMRSLQNGCMAGEQNDSLVANASKGSQGKLQDAPTKEHFCLNYMEVIEPLQPERSKALDLNLEGTKNRMMSTTQSNTACKNYNLGPGHTSNNKSQHKHQRKAKISGRRYVSSKPVAQLFASKEVQKEVQKYEEIKNKATSELNSLYDEIRPEIEEHERDRQDSVPTTVAEKWIHATCSKWKAEFDFHFSIVKNVMCPPDVSDDQSQRPGEDDSRSEIKYLTN